MRTKHPLAALTLVVVLASPVLAAIRPNYEPLAFAPVPDVGASSIRVATFDGPSVGVPPLPSVRPSGGAPKSRIVPTYVRPIIPIPSPRLIVIRLDTGGLRSSGSHARKVRGTASWFCGGGSPCTRGFPASGLYAAAGPALRVGDWRGRSVLVSANGRSVRVILSDWCACPSRVIDLYRSAFSRLADPSRGVLTVTVSW